MAALELVLLLLACAAGLRLLAEWLRVPYPSVLVVGGAVLALIPGLPATDLSPDILFLIFVPPLLYWTAITYPLRDVRRRAGPILRLAVVLVLVTMSAVAIAAHSWISPPFSWAAAFALGAIVAPPDPVAVVSMVRELRLPRVVRSVLEGEGLFNDVTALVAYRIAVAAAVTGEFDASRIAREFAFAAVVGAIMGLAVAAVTLRVHRVARAVPAVEMAVSLLTPFAAYLSAERLGGSGVLAVVAAGLYTAREFPRIAPPQARVQSVALWSVTAFLLESLVFILVGLELPNVLHGIERARLVTQLGEALLLTLIVIAIRLIWIPPTSYVGQAIGRLFWRTRTPWFRFRDVTFVSWAGLRGSDSLIIALALPITTASGAPFPQRERIVFITFVVIFATLVLQGPTLPFVARALRIESDDDNDAEEAHARLVAAEAGLNALDSPDAASTEHPEVVRYLRQRHRQRARRWAARESHTPTAPWLRHDHVVAAPSHDAGVVDEERVGVYQRLRRDMIAAELKAVFDLRDQGIIDDDVMRRIQRDLDFEWIMLETREPVADSPGDLPT
jgi:CPA1 family monovalent cation:H+ antiporter